MESSINRPRCDTACGEEAIEEYLTQLCDQLSSLPAERQTDVRRELRQHLELRLEDLHELGSISPAAALGRLVNEFGDPTTIGRQLARTWRTPNKVARPWARGVAFCTFAASVCMSFYLISETCRQFGWSNSLVSYALTGPLIPLWFGLCWGRRDVSKPDVRWGYPVIAALSMLLSAFVPLPHFITHVELPSEVVADLSLCGRLCDMLVWTWLACSVCGLTSILTSWYESVRENRPIAS